MREKITVPEIEVYVAVLQYQGLISHVTVHTTEDDMKASIEDWTGMTFDDYCKFIEDDEHRPGLYDKYPDMDTDRVEDTRYMDAALAFPSALAIVDSLKAVVEELESFVEGEGCDHSAGFCYCSTFGALDHAKRLLAASYPPMEEEQQ